MLSVCLALLPILGEPSTLPTQPRAVPLPGGKKVLVAPGPPKLLGAEILDGGHTSIDKGVKVAFGPQGRRYEVWEVHKGTHLDHALVLAYDADGAELWRTKYTWPAHEPWSQSLAVTVDPTGALYVMYITTGVSNPYRWRLVKVDPTGARAWDKTLYSTTWGEEPAFLAPHPQGGVVVHSTANGQVRDLYTARVSAAGDVLWETKLDVGSKNQLASGLAVAADGSVYAVGHDDAIRVRKYAADGAVLWTQDYAGTTQYEHLAGRHAFLDRDGNLVVAGSTYAGGNDPDWIFALKYDPRGTRVRTFVSKIGPTPKLFEYGLQGVYATHGPDDTIYFAWDHKEQLDTAWTLASVRVPGEDPRTYTPEPLLRELPQVVWTKTFDGDAAMNVERLVWFPNGAVGVLGRGKRKLAGYDYRSDTRLRAVTPAGDDLGVATYGSPGDFHNEPEAVAVSPSGLAYVLGWQYWSGDGWNDENVMRLRFSVTR